ncbi:hypothetical protein EV426DRAFT_578102 [Tirmania nivea]|nr:hypothetical protein EV426DRAFT_578102 [Tirmania nivea]
MGSARASGTRGPPHHGCTRASGATGRQGGKGRKDDEGEAEENEEIGTIRHEEDRELSSRGGKEVRTAVENIRQISQGQIERAFRDELRSMSMEWTKLIQDNAATTSSNAPISASVHSNTCPIPDEAGEYRQARRISFVPSRMESGATQVLPSQYRGSPPTTVKIGSTYSPYGTNGRGVKRKQSKEVKRRFSIPTADSEENDTPSFIRKVRQDWEAGSERRSLETLPTSRKRLGGGPRKYRQCTSRGICQNRRNDRRSQSSTATSTSTAKRTDDLYRLLHMSELAHIYRPLDISYIAVNIAAIGVFLSMNLQKGMRHEDCVLHEAPLSHTT